MPNDNNYYRKRKDSKNRLLRRGESVRANGKYQFKYSVNGKPKFVYSWRLEPTDPVPKGRAPGPSLRELEKKIGYDQETLLDPSRKNMTVMELVERYLSTRVGVKSSTKTGYKLISNGQLRALKVGRSYRVPKIYLFTYLWFLLLGLSGTVISTSPISIAGRS